MAFLVGLSLWASVADARPPSSTLFAADAEIETLDSDDGRFRVHYTTVGSDATVGDDDGDGIADGAQVALATLEQSAAFYESLGFAPFATEEELGITGGGTDAYDLYLVEASAGSNGSHLIENCLGTLCGGYIIVAPDFRTSSLFRTWQNGLTAVVSHELFHAYQAAYGPDLPQVVGEGLAVWAAHAYDANPIDYYDFVSYFMQAPERPILEPPPFSLQAYSSGILWNHLALRHPDSTMMPELMAALSAAAIVDIESDIMPVIEEVLVAHDDSLEEAFRDFATAVLACGPLAGDVPSFPDAADLVSVTPLAEGTSVDHSQRLFSYSALYYQIDHPGGTMMLDSAGSNGAERVELSIFSTEEGRLQPASWEGGLGEQVSIELPAGDVWVMATLVDGGNSVSVDLCAGPPLAVDACTSVEPDEPEVTDTGDQQAIPTEPTPSTDEDQGCGCAQGSDGAWMWLALVAVGARRRTQS